MKLSDLFFDRRCKLCDVGISKGAVCSECDEKLKSVLSVRKRYFRIDGRNIEARYLFEYDSECVKKLLFALKRNADRDLFEYAANLYLMAFPDDFSGCVTCCPRGGRGYRNYGYDQVAKPCKLLCRNSDGKFEFAKILKRRGFSKQQKNLSLEERQINTRGKFRAVKKDIPKNILLLDDVVTTGSTVISCAGELLCTFPDANLSFAFLASRNGFSGK